MAFTAVHLSAPTGSEALYAWKTLLKAAGWTVTTSSDGTTYSAVADVITTGASGANGLANSKAWFVIANPAGPSLCFQRSTSANETWRVKFSARAGFTGGSPGATQVPSATDEGTAMLGSGTDASPGFATLFPSDTTYRYNAGVNSVAPRTFYSVAFTAGGSNPNHALMFDGLQASTFAAGDTFPYIMYVDGTTNAFASNLYNDPTKYRTMIAGGSTIYQAAIANYQHSPVTSGLNPNLVTGLDDLLPVIYIAKDTSAGALIHVKGESSMVLWETVGSVSAPRDTPFQLQGAGVNDLMLFGILVFPWDGTAVVV